MPPIEDITNAETAGKILNGLFAELALPIVAAEILVEDGTQALRLMRVTEGEGGQPEFKDIRFSTPTAHKLHGALRESGLLEVGPGKGKTFAQARPMFTGDNVLAVFLEKSAVVAGAGDLTLLVNPKPEGLMEIRPALKNALCANFCVK